MVVMITIRINFAKDDTDKKLKCVRFKINTTDENHP